MKNLHLQRMSALMLRQFYLMRGSPARLLSIFIWSAVDIVVWGFVSRYLNTFSAAGLDVVPWLLGAVLFWQFFHRAQAGVCMAFCEDVWARNFLNFFASPLALSEYLGALTAASMLTSSLGFGMMLVLAALAFGLSVSIYGLLLAPFLLVLIMFGMALGIFSSAAVLRLGPAAEWLVWPMPAVLSPFVGVFYPISTLPRWMQWISSLLPPTYVFESMRTIVSGGEFSLLSLLWSAGLSVVYVLLACWFFARVYRHVVRTGLIARYSAETAG